MGKSTRQLDREIAESLADRPISHARVLRSDSASTSVCGRRPTGTPRIASTTPST